MAAVIKSNPGLTAQLVEGHNGIFEVTVNGQNLYDNQGKCSQLPKTEDIIKSLETYLDYPAGSLKTNNKMQIQLLNTKQAADGCECLDIAKLTAPSAGSCCCTPSAPTGQSSCCAPQEIDPSITSPEKRSLEIEFLYLDLNVCVPCRGTESSLEEAISEVSRVLEATGIEVHVRKIHVQTEEQALALGFVSSPTIRINGRDIQLEVRESLCESCGDLCGDDVDCRVWVYRGKEYSVPPKGLIIEAILREVYKEPGEDAAIQPRLTELPENLKRFFAARQKKEGNLE